MRLPTSLGQEVWGASLFWAWEDYEYWKGSEENLKKGSAKFIDADAIVDDISPTLFDALKEIGQEVINEVLDEKPELSWRTVVGGQVIFEFSKRRSEIEELVRRAILNAIKDRIP